MRDPRLKWINDSLAHSFPYFKAASRRAGLPPGMAATGEAGYDYQITTKTIGGSAVARYQINPFNRTRPFPSPQHPAA